ncbi:Acetyl-CoA carboxylase 2 [Camellia lanceoleosa]|uniref:Acetyl-CoA carboxylase 2 n=1 Tax=Camellia lanceoleosa TaxID=1840588 RepID=A0ACC0FGA0_9ERIC|nr:Acetyl-CoA carboxylase 2 [Camellia lanceoleosa]
MEHGGGYNAWRRTSVFATPFDFDKAESTRPKGHCVAMHVTNEDPDDGFKPTSGKVQKASTSSAAMVSEYVGYLEKGKIPPKGSFVIKVKGPEGWSWDPDQVPFVVDQAGCNANEDINFRFTGLTVSGRVVGSVGGESCSNKNGGPSNVNVELLSPTGDLVTSVLTSPTGSYPFTNIILGKYKLRASRPDFNVEVRGSVEVELGFENGLVDDIFFLPGYNIRGSAVAQRKKLPELAFGLMEGLACFRTFSPNFFPRKCLAAEETVAAAVVASAATAVEDATHTLT